MRLYNRPWNQFDPHVGSSLLDSVFWRCWEHPFSSFSVWSIPSLHFLLSLFPYPHLLPRPPHLSSSVGASLLVWTGCGILALLGSLCYAELGSVISESGGEYAYFLRIYKGKENRHLGNIIAFLFTWVRT